MWPVVHTRYQWIWTVIHLFDIFVSMVYGSARRVWESPAATPKHLHISGSPVKCNWCKVLLFECKAVVEIVTRKMKCRCHKGLSLRPLALHVESQTMLYKDHDPVAILWPVWCGRCPTALRQIILSRQSYVTQHLYEMTEKTRQDLVIPKWIKQSSCAHLRFMDSMNRVWTCSVYIQLYCITYFSLF